MLDWESLLALYPMQQRVYTRHILREYLQFEILNIIYRSPFASSLNFLGGTALRIVHNSPRFSEDLDFDNIKLSPDDFQQLAKHIQQELEKSGYQIETREVYKGAYRCYIRFQHLLFERGISGYTEEKVLIQLDTALQKYVYNSEIFVINKFGLFSYISVVPKATLLSQKLHTIFERKRIKGRDYFDVVFLFSLTQPDYKYLSEKLGITELAMLKERLLSHTINSDLEILAKDVEPFLIDKNQNDRVLLFKTFVESL